MGLAVRTFTWLSLALTLLCQPHQTASQRRPAELGSSIILVSYTDFELQDYGGVQQRLCDYAIPRARSAGASTISFVVTGLWVGGQAGVTQYAYKDAAGTLFSPTEQSLAYWQAGLQACFAAAISAGFTGLHILPHIDDPADVVYRNELLFDPTAQYSGFSYEDVILNPITNALLATANPASTRIWYTLGGELGRSTVGYSQRYHEIMDRLRIRFQGSGFEVAAPGSFSATARVKLGVSFNWNKHCGCLPELNNLSTQDVNSTYAAAFAANQAALSTQVDAAALRSLLQASDFIGVSSYAGLPLTPQVTDMELSLSYFAHEMSFWGVDLAALTSCEGRQLIYSEQGLGGGELNAPNTVDYIASHPEKGRWLLYTPAQDPWLNPEAQAYRRSVYALFTQWLSQGGGPAFKIDAAYLWSTGTFDVQAIHPISSSPEGSYGDETIAEQIRALNANANDPALLPLPPVVCPAPRPSPVLPVVPSPLPPSPALEQAPPVGQAQVPAGQQPVPAGQEPVPAVQPVPVEQPPLVVQPPPAAFESQLVPSAAPQAATRRPLPPPALPPPAQQASKQPTSPPTAQPPPARRPSALASPAQQVPGQPIKPPPQPPPTPAPRPAPTPAPRPATPKPQARVPAAKAATAAGKPPSPKAGAPAGKTSLAAGKAVSVPGKQPPAKAPAAAKAQAPTSGQPPAKAPAAAKAQAPKSGPRAAAPATTSKRSPPPPRKSLPQMPPRKTTSAPGPRPARNKSAPSPSTTKWPQR